MSEETSRGRNKSNASTEQRLTTAQKRAKAIQLRIAGASYEQIAAKVGYASRGAAHKAVNEEIAKIPREPAKDLLALELQRLDAMHLALWTQAIQEKDQFAIDRIVKLMDHRAKLTGLYQMQAEDNSEAVKTALLDFARGLDKIVGGDDGYGSEYVPNDSDTSTHGEPGDEPS